MANFLPLPTWAHSDCPGVAAKMADLANAMTGEAPIRVAISAEPPPPGFPYETVRWPCPHGTVYWIMPGEEHVAEWEAAKAAGTERA